MPELRIETQEDLEDVDPDETLPYWRISCLDCKWVGPYRYLKSDAEVDLRHTCSEA